MHTEGYRDDQLDRPPSNDPETAKLRQVAVPMIIQCDRCLKWRRLPYVGKGEPLTQTQLECWQCSDNIDVLNNTYVYFRYYSMQFFDFRMNYFQMYSN